MSVLACFSIKGGVGKTTTAVNLAHIAAAKGLRTLIWDLDPQGAASFYLKARPDAEFEQSLANDVKQLARYVVPSNLENLDIIPTKFSNTRLNDVLLRGEASNSRLKAMLFPVLKNYDLIILDCPPGVSALTNNAIHAADLTLVPTIPAPLSVRTVRQLRKHVRNEKLDTTLLSFFSMQDTRRASHRSTVDYHQRVAAGEVLNTVIPYSAVIERIGVKRKPLSVYAGTSAAAIAYSSLFEEIRPVLRLENTEPQAISEMLQSKPQNSRARSKPPTLANKPKSLSTRRKVRPVRFDARS